MRDGAGVSFASAGENGVVNGGARGGAGGGAGGGVFLGAIQKKKKSSGIWKLWAVSPRYFMMWGFI
jgi:hypothetical protein